ncbi:MAG: hypothetical protein EOO15_16320 [Chitinophagaceae bacterium]|nr:MAG: hypothetical protein EOO15_16320 [Chitinophagaceae bacterium]
MRNQLAVILVAALLIAGGVMAPYFYSFHGALAGNSQEWSNFGSYVGGTLGPLYALLAFGAGVQALLDNRQQSTRQSLLGAIQRYEADFEACCGRMVTCSQPWIWGNLPSETFSVTQISLRTLLNSDSIDWEQHLWPLVLGHGFQILDTGEVLQDREILWQASQAVEGIFAYLSMYELAGGDIALVAYLNQRYEIPKMRLQSAAMTAAEGEEREK